MYLHVQLLQLLMQLHQLSNYINCFSNELKEKKNYTFLFAVIKMQFA